MKRRKLIFILAPLFFLPKAFAEILASNKTASFCADMTQVEALQDLSAETIENLQAENLRVERIVISKDRKKIYLISGDNLLRSFPAAFGQAPVGAKQFQGDMKTPEGIYRIDSKNPHSEYTKALHISYPNQIDQAYARTQGKTAGGDVMIHGFPVDEKLSARVAMYHPRNWTNGCVAVTNDQIEEIYALVKERTLVEICPMTQGPSSPETDQPDIRSRSPRGTPINPSRLSPRGLRQLYGQY